MFFITIDTVDSIKKNKMNISIIIKNGIVSFSTIPLKLASVIGFIFCLTSIIYIFYVVINYLFNGSHITSGYSSLMCVVLLGFGLTLLVLGIIGQYIAQMYNEVKNRPKYIINECSSNIKKM